MKYVNGGSIDYEHFYNNGYDKYEVYLGVQLIELYMMLKMYRSS